MYWRSKNGHHYALYSRAFDTRNSGNFRMDTWKSQNNATPGVEKFTTAISRASWKGGEFIMKKGQWDEENLESLLKQAPKVIDHRSKDELFNRLKNEGLFNEQPPQKQSTNQKGIRWAPLLVSIAS